MNHNANLTDKTCSSAKIVRNNRIKLLGLFAIVFVPMAAATSMYFAGWGIPTGSTNHGALIWPPMNIAELQAKDEQGLPLEQHFALDEPGARPLKWDLLTADADNDASESKWVLLVTGEEVCNTVCQQALYTVRQVNIALGKEAKRVTRVLVSDQNASALPIELSEQHPRLALATTGSASLQQFSAMGAGNNKAAVERWNIWVVDPLGNVILRYEANRHGKDILKDMKRLLKLSNIG